MSSISDKLGKINFWGVEFDEKIAKSHKRDLAFIKTFLKFWAIPLLIAAGLGMYLSLSILPWVVSAMVAGGLAPWLAALLGILLAGGLVLGLLAVPLSRCLQMLPLLTLYRTEAPINQAHAGFSRFNVGLLSRLLGFILGVLPLLAGFVFGIYLSSLIAPLVISALTAMGLSYGWALLAGITASMILIAITMDLLAQPMLIFQACVRFRHLSNCILDIEMDSSNRNIFKGKLLPYALMGIVGMVFGIYFATVLAPLIMMNLPGISVAIAGFIAVAVSVAVIAVCARVFSMLGMWADAFISRMALPREKEGRLTELGIKFAKMEMVQALVLGGPLTELTYFVRQNDRWVEKSGGSSTYEVDASISDGSTHEVDASISDNTASSQYSQF